MSTELPDRMLSRRQVTPTGCWEWTGSRDPNGYGRFRWGKRVLRAHRVVAHLVHGLDLADPRQFARHKCDNPPCFNPDHIEPGTPRDNYRDGIERGRIAPQRLRRRPPLKPTCGRGHLFDEANTRWRPDGTRACRACALLNGRNQPPRTCPDCGVVLAGGMSRHRSQYCPMRHQLEGSAA